MRLGMASGGHDFCPKSQSKSQQRDVQRDVNVRCGQPVWLTSGMLTGLQEAFLMELTLW